MVTNGATITGIGGGATNVTDFETVTLNASAGGIDTLDYTGTAVGVTVDLSTDHATGFTGGVYSGAIENVTGGSGNDTLTGSVGNNTLSGGDGDDTLVYNVTATGTAVTSGQDTFVGGNNSPVGDTAEINGTAATETYNVNPVAAQFGINVQVSGDATPVAGVAADAGNSEVLGSTIEEIVINTNGGGDSVIISGDLGSTGVATHTVTVNGDAGDNTFDASGITGRIRSALPSTVTAATTR